MEFVKTDNKSLTDKCELRRFLIEETKMEPLRVLDLFAGEGHIWNELRRVHRDPDAPKPLQVTRYTPVDASERQKGQIRAKITPSLIAALDENEGLRRYNVIDIDTYGEPWEIWAAVLSRIKQPTLVFLTRGKVTYGGGKVSNFAKQVMGIPLEWQIPVKLDVFNYADECALKQECATARITKGYIVALARVDYYGLLVEPISI